jgi:hypothetical protein
MCSMPPVVGKHEGNEMKYRVNYGNGQVNQHKSLADCRREIAEMDLYKEFAFVQQYSAGSADSPGEWVRVRERQ